MIAPTTSPTTTIPRGSRRGRQTSHAPRIDAPAMARSGRPPTDPRNCWASRSSEVAPSSYGVAARMKRPATRAATSTSNSAKREAVVRSPGSVVRQAVRPLMAAAMRKIGMANGWSVASRSTVAPTSHR